MQSSQSTRQVRQVVCSGGVGRYSRSRHAQVPFLTIGTKNRLTSHEVQLVNPRLSTAVAHPFTAVHN
jgi:hypothetical protein